MQRTWLTLVVLAWLGIGGTALAQTQDTIGLFFDEQGTVSETQTTAPNQVVRAWLLLQNPSQPGGISGWECEIGIRSAGTAPLVVWEVQGSNINFATPPSFSVGLGAPLPDAAAIVLAKATIIMVEPTRVDFTILPFTPPSLQEPPGVGYPVQQPLYSSDQNGQLYPLTVAAGCPALPVATVNSDGPVTAPGLSGVPQDVYLNADSAGETTSAVLQTVNNTDAVIIGEIAIGMAGCRYKHSGGFYTDEPTTFRVQPGADFVIDLTYTLPVAGLVDGWISLTVCGEESVVSLHGGGTLQCSVAPTSISLGDVPLGSIVTRTVTVRNQGTYEIDATPSFLSPCTAFTWALIDSTIDPAHLGANESFEVRITYEPLVENHHYCTLIFGDGSCSAVALDGRGLDLPPICSAPTNLAFGDVVVDSTSLVYLNITNSGGGLLTGDVALVGSPAGFSIVSGAGPFTLAPDTPFPIIVALRPTAVGDYSATLDLGTSCAPVALSGRGIDGAPSFTLFPANFGVREIGGEYSRYLRVINTGPVSISGDLQIVGDSPFSLVTPGPFTLAPGHAQNSLVLWRPENYGEATVDVVTGLPGDPLITCTGFGVDTLSGSFNQIGFYFDPQFTITNVDVDPGSTIPGYLVLQQPSAGIAGWELQLLVAGDAYPLGWTFNGTASGDLGPSRFQVALDAPLPAAASVLLATADIMVPNRSGSYITATAVNDPAIPGYGSYEDAGNPGQYLPLGRTDGVFLGVINYGPVGVVAPAAPTAQVQGQEVRLTWLCGDDKVDGYRVYRSLDGTEPVRLTTALLVCREGQGEYIDRSQIAAGTEVAYTLTQLTEGVESSPSPAATITATGGVPGRTRLLANYPNPFNPSTTVPFSLARPGEVKLAVYDAAGKLIRVLADGGFGAGLTERVWFGRDSAGNRVPSGVYYLRLETETGIQVGKILLLK